MPILSPSLQNHLVNSFPIQEPDRSINFILRYLRFASLNINKNYTTFKTSILFKNDLKKWINSKVNNLPLISEPFIDIYREDIRDYYKYLYDKIDDPDKNYLSKQHDGNYFICDDGFQTKLFQPFSMNPVAYSWFLSDSPIAILCIDGNKLNYFNFYYWIKLEIDLMAAAGFTLVFCGIGISGSLDILLKDHQFAEIHLNNNNPNYFGHNNLDFDLIKFNNYFYFYTIIQNKESKEIIKKYKNDSHFHIFSFCKTPNESIKKIIMHQTREFYYCQTGFSLDFLCIRLSNIPIYDSKNDDIDFTPSESSGISIGYIKPNDFLRWSKNRKEILFDKECKHLSVKYINYDDIHLIKPELYVNDTLSLADISTAKYDKILKIKPEIIKELTKKDKFKKERFFNLCKNEKKIENLIKYASYAYSFIQSQKSTFFEIHEVQLLTAMEACNQLILNKTESKGTIFQVETGEGKSCIINIVAAALVLMKKTVHIVSSNIILSNRDYNNSLDFFNLLGISSAVLLHENELPYNDQSKKTDDITDCDEYLNKCFNYSNNPDIEQFSKEKYPEKFFGQELFENPLRMNLEICGVNIHNDDKKKCEKAQIVFSTFVNFECLYLKLVESSNDSISKYFSNCGLIIDEADSILIDEIENGTILSTSMNTNAIPILKFVYDQHKKNVSVQNTLNEILKIWPKAIDIKERDIKQMYDEIDLINEDEFTNGKKYSIETFTVDENNEILPKKFYKKTLKSFEKRKDDDDIQYPHSFKYIVPLDEIHIIDTFIEIHKIVTKKYEMKINQKFNTYFKRFNNLSSFFSCQIGFIPFSLLNKSGSRIDSGEIGELNYIIDPELIYERQNSENRKFILSITERIDEIFNSICQKINELINQKIGLKFFLRRGLAGCEFGLCLDLEMQNEELNNDDNDTLFDRDPLLLFSISVKSVIPVFAGILIIALVYIGSICAKIIMWISSLIPMATKEIIGAFIKVIIKAGAGIIIDKAYDSINDFLLNILTKQINIIKAFDTEIGYIIENLIKVFYSCELDTLGEKISNLCDCKIKIKSKIGSKIYGAINYSKLIKTSVLLILCIGSFIFNFSNNKKRVKNKFQHEKEVSSEYETNFQNNFLKNKAVRYITNKEKVVELMEKNKDEVPITDEIKDISPRNYFNNFILNSKTFVLKMESCNIFNYIISPEYCVIGKMRRKIGSTIIHDCKCAQNSYIRIQRQGYIENVHQEVVFYSVLKHLMIINFLGFYTEGKKSFVFISNQQNGFLDECIEHKELNYTQKLIIAYGIARIMRYLHRSKIIHGDLKASNILLNSNYYPKLYNFYKSRHIEKKSPEIKIDKKEMQYMPPEFILDSDNCCNSFKIDVYSYGLLLFSLITDSDPFATYKDKNKIYTDVINGIRPQFPPDIRYEWKDLINNCWNNNPDKRPNFEKIIAKLRYDVFQKDASEEFDNYIKYCDQIENKNII